MSCIAVKKKKLYTIAKETLSTFPKKTLTWTGICFPLVNISEIARKMKLKLK